MDNHPTMFEQVPVTSSITKFNFELTICKYSTPVSIIIMLYIAVPILAVVHRMISSAIHKI